MLSHFAQLESVRCEGSRLWVFLELIIRECSISRVVRIAAEFKRVQSQALVEAESECSQDFEGILPEVRSILNDHLSFICSSYGLLLYDVDRVLQKYLRRHFEAVPERTVLFCFASTDYEHTHFEALPQSVSSTAPVSSVV